MLHKIRKVFSPLTKIFKRKYYGFLGCNYQLQQAEVDQLKVLLYQESRSFTNTYEQELSKYLGGGNVKTFASGRMAFYSLLNVIGVSSGDEIVLTGYTCSVVVNAALRTGAKVVFSDIDEDTLGMDPVKLRAVINERTKVVVAQHSFGIPCKIDKISAICKERHIFLIEDCALSLGSKYEGRILGNWGDAAIFSTDHSKPINTLIGGFLYTNSNTLFEKIVVVWEQSPELSLKKRSAILKRLLWERKYYSPFRYKYLTFLGYYDCIRRLLLGEAHPFLEKDYAPQLESHQEYNYPSKLPEFLSYLGRLELKSYIDNALEKHNELYNFIVRMSDRDVNFPSAYFDKKCEIIPLRIIFRTKRSITGEMSRVLDVDWIWFRAPIVCTNSPLFEYGYVERSCATSEEVCIDIFNIPITVKDPFLTKYLFQILTH